MKSAPIITTDAHGQKINGKTQYLVFFGRIPQTKGLHLDRQQPPDEEKNYIERNFCMVSPSWPDGFTFFVM